MSSVYPRSLPTRPIPVQRPATARPAAVVRSGAGQVARCVAFVVVSAVVGAVGAGGLLAGVLVLFPGLLLVGAR